MAVNVTHMILISTCNSII